MIVYVVNNKNSHHHWHHCHILHHYPNGKVAVQWHLDQKRGYVDRKDLVLLDDWHRLYPAPKRDMLGEIIAARAKRKEDEAKEEILRQADKWCKRQDRL